MCPVRIRVGVSDSVYAVWYIYQGDPLVPIWLPGHGAIGLSRHTTCEIVLKWIYSITLLNCCQCYIFMAAQHVLANLYISLVSFLHSDSNLTVV